MCQRGVGDTSLDAPAICAARARRALLILGDMDPKTAEQWLRLAETMLGAGAGPAEILRLGAPDKIDAPAK